MWELTNKRREVLARFCVNTFTVALAGLIVPFVLRSQPLNAMILVVGIVIAALMVLFAYILEA